MRESILQVQRTPEFHCIDQNQLKYWIMAAVLVELQDYLLCEYFDIVFLQRTFIVLATIHFNTVNCHVYSCLPLKFILPWELITNSEKVFLSWRVTHDLLVCFFFSSFIVTQFIIIVSSLTSVIWGAIVIPTIVFVKFRILH